MNKLLFLIALSCMILFTSCSTVHKSMTKTASHTDSTGQKSSSVVDVKKKDSTGTATVETLQAKTSDSGYKKTTVVKEFFTDEMDLGPEEEINTGVKAVDFFPTDTTHQNTTKADTKQLPKKPHKLLYRETTTTEEGRLQKNETGKETKAQNTSLQTVDTSGNTQAQSTTLKKGATETDRNTNRFHMPFLISLSIGLFLFLLLAYIAYRLYKKYRNKIPI